jgi:hypothetical protein
MRGSNQIVVLNELRNTLESADFQAAWHSANALIGKLPDPNVRRELLDKSIRTSEMQHAIIHANNVCNFYENIGILVKSGLVQKQPVLEMWAPDIAAQWSVLVPYIALLRRRSPAACEHFEYLAVLSEDWLALRPEGTYPSNMRRAAVPDPWLAEDRKR